MISLLTLTYGNRLPVLKECIRSIKSRTQVDKEIIVVNNGSEEIKDWLASQHDIKSLSLEKNEGVCARNYGLEMASGDIIVQVDDDVVVLDGWTEIVLPHFKDPKIGGVGVQGAKIDAWLSYNPHNIKVGDYVDVLTGFFWAYRNCGARFDWNLGPFWDEESDFQLELKSRGYKLKTCPWCVSHNCQRNEPVNWELHNKNRDYVRNKWQPREKDLDLEGMKKEEVR